MGSRSRPKGERDMMGETRWHGLTPPFSDSELAVYDAARRAKADAFDWSGCALLVVDVTGSFFGTCLVTAQAARAT